MASRLVLQAAALGGSLAGFLGISGQTALTPVKLPSTDQHTLTSAKIGHRYELLVSLPPDYGTASRSYPVLYVLDGWYFPLLVFLQNSILDSERIPPIIVVNVSHGTGDVMSARARDFTPTRTSSEANSGGASEFLDFLEHEVIPFVDRTYRTVSTDRGLLGHSYGGLFAIYALEERPALFQRVIAASPALYWDDRVLVRRASERLRNLGSHVRLDLSTGDEGGITASTKSLVRALQKLKPAGLEYRFMKQHGETHTSVPLRSFPEGMYWVYGKGR